VILLLLTFNKMMNVTMSLFLYVVPAVC
jgi:hypothetical protein